MSHRIRCKPGLRHGMMMHLRIYGPLQPWFDKT